MKALTLIQPWATLIIDGRKKIETRSWKTKLTGIFAVHAGKKVDTYAAERFGYDPTQLPTSSILGTAELYDCFQFTENTWEEMRDTEEVKYGDFDVGRYGFRLQNVIEFEEPISAKSSLGFWEWEGQE
ncbi:MAG: ASCH domain-containing protein [Thaumarchaeota archaeon]|nr:ASCH domain-containing protein [Nitrososphaerota archaeon]